MRGESCHFTWLVKTCIPTPNDTTPAQTTSPIPPKTTTISALPDDILLDCLSRVPSSSLLSLSRVCLRWAHLLLSPFFLSLRRTRRLLLPSVFALSLSSSSGALAVSSLPNLTGPWRVGPAIPGVTSLSLTHSRLAAVGPRIYVVGREGTLLCYDAWSEEVAVRSPMPSAARRFAANTVSGRIYVASGGNEVEVYDPVEDVWRVAAHAPRRRYGCVGAVADGVLYLIGGLKVGGSGDMSRAAAVGAVEARVYAGSMDLYDVEGGGVWLRSRAVPGGGCVVAACAAAGQLYILASHAVELSFWRFDARRKGRDGSVGGGGGWSRLRSPPLPAQVRLDNTIRFSCVGVDDKVVLIQVIGSIDDLLRRSGRSTRGIKEGLVLIYDSASGEWTRGADLPEAISRAACVSVEC